jgi:hypothetical protein
MRDIHMLRGSLVFFIFLLIINSCNKKSTEPENENNASMIDHTSTKLSLLSSVKR